MPGTHESMLQSMAGIVNKDYVAQKSILADVDAGKISREELFARGQYLVKERQRPAGVVKPAEQKTGAVLA